MAARLPDGWTENVHLDENGEPRMVERRFRVEDELAGLRLDHFLKHKIPRLSRTKLQKIIRTELKRSDGKTMKGSSRVSPGDLFVIRHEARPEPACPRNFGILYSDEQMMVIDKPAGLPMHSSAKFYFNTVTFVLRETYPDEPLQICHRLDRETSGVLVVARGKANAARLKGQFSRHTVQKSYTAIVHGCPEWHERDIDAPLGLTCDPDARIDIRMVVREDAPPARTHVTVLERKRHYALLRCKPITGRQHQIRVHLAHVGFPIVGDKLYTHGDEAFAAYCDTGLTNALLVQFELHRQALHAASICLRHPASDELLTIAAPLPPELADFFASRS